MEFIIIQKRCTRIILKADDERKTFYTNIGFTPIDNTHRLLKLPFVKNYYNEMNLDTVMKQFILEDNVVIGHNKVNFINHFYHPPGSVTISTKFDAKENKELVSKIHDIFVRPSFKNKIQYLDKNENNVHKGFV